MRGHKIGDRAVCALCGNPIEYIGPHWRHIGQEYRHIARPAAECPDEYGNGNHNWELQSETNEDGDPIKPPKVL